MLPMPQPEDGLPELLSKLIAITEVARSRKNIAEPATLTASPVQDRNAEKIAMSQMRPQEHVMWK